MARHPAPTFVFADLVGFTALTERCGDETAARVAARVPPRDVRAQPGARRVARQVAG